MYGIVDCRNPTDFLEKMHKSAIYILCGRWWTVQSVSGASIGSERLTPLPVRSWYVSDAAYPDGWEVWNDEPEGRLVLVYHPEVFDGSAFPPACMPTITVSPSSPDRPPGERPVPGRWYVTLYLEPDVRVREEDGRFDSRERALDGARDIATRFATGQIEYREVYQIPREGYLDELDSLTGGA